MTQRGAATVADVGTDKQWVAVEQVVRQAFADKHVLEYPPQSPDEWMWLVASITDHLCAAFEMEPRRRG